LGLGFKNPTKEDSYLKSATPDTYITATQVCELQSKIADLGLIIPITLVLDNARYQKCKIVEELALSLSIELLYLPSYSPNLNLKHKKELDSLLTLRFQKFNKSQIMNV